MTLKTLRGSGGGSSSYHRTPDNLFSTDVVEALFGISEGPIYGLVDGAKSFYVGDTPLQSINGTNNFDHFELIIRDGNEVGEEIRSRTGGFGTSTTVNTELETATAVVRQGTQTNIDYIDVRLVINRLYREDDEGNYEHQGKVKIEYKKSSESSWHPIKTFRTNPVDEVTGNGWKAIYGTKNSNNVVGSSGDRPFFWTSIEPVTTAAQGAIWIDSGNGNTLKRWSGAQWVTITNLTTTTVGGFTLHTWHEGRLFIGNPPPNMGAKQGDFWANLDDGVVYCFNGSTWFVAGSSLTPGMFGGSDGSLTISNGEVRIKGKTTSPFVKEFRIPVENVDDDVYQIRVTKTSPVNTTKEFFDVTFESFQEVRARGFKFPGLATTQLVARASDQFSSIPQFSGIYRGRIVRVPSNYDPEARTYAGVWDGTWKMAYTNNPAFVMYDLIMNDRYGMNAYYPIEVNKWDVYEAGQWCDTRRADGKPRFTFNMLLQDPRGGREAVDFIAGVFGGRFFDDGNGYGVIRIDRNNEPVAIFSPENVEDGLFIYSWTEISSRYNDITVTFANPQLLWAEDRRRVFDQDHIDKYGRIPLNFIAVGCTDEAEAIARARYKLITSITENRIVNFKTNRQGLYLSPYDIILIADDEMAGGLHGRVHEVTGNNSFSLRDPLFLEPGYNYRVAFTLVDPETGDFKVYKYNLAQGLNGTVTELVIDGTLPDLPEKAVFAVETTDGSAAPRAFRIMSINEVDGEPDNIEIQAVEVNRAKWAYVDGHVHSPSEGIIEYEVRPHQKPAPVPHVTIRPIRQRGQVDLIIEWEPSPSTLVQKYRVLVSRNNGGMQFLTETNARVFEWMDVPPGEYVFHVIAVTAYGRESEPTIIEHRLVGDYRLMEPITNLRLIDEPFEDIYESRSPQFVWDASDHPDFYEYVVQIHDPSNNLKRMVHTKEPRFVYEFERNRMDHGGTAARMFTISVAAKDYYGAVSEFTSLTVNNPPPAAPTGIVANQVFYSAAIQYSLPTERDVVGAVVHISTSPSFTPGPNTLVYKGNSDNISVPLEPGNYFIRVAAYDVFGDTDLNYSTPVQIEIISIELDTEPPAVPSGLALSSRIDKVDGVVQRQVLTATFGAVSDEDFAYYDIEIRQGSGNWVSFQTASPTFEWDVLPEQTYTVRVRSVDALGNKSAFSPNVSHTTPECPELAHLINEGSVAIDAGKIRIAGATMLSDWRTGSDNTEINGGAISANTIQANALTIGQRNITVEDILFEHNSPTLNHVSWTNGSIKYVGDDGNVHTRTIAAGSAAFTSGTLYIYWIKGSTTLAASNNLATAFGADRVVLATYRGTNILVTDYGRTVIDGSHIKTGTIQSEQIAANVIDTHHLKANSIDTIHLKANSIKAQHIDTEELSAISADLGEVTAGVLKSTDNKFVIDLNNKTISIEV